MLSATILINAKFRTKPNSLHHFKQTQLEPITAFYVNAEIREDEEVGIFIVMFGVFEVVQRRDDGASRATRAAILICNFTNQILVTAQGRRDV